MPLKRKELYGLAFGIFMMLWGIAGLLVADDHPYGLLGAVLSGIQTAGAMGLVAWTVLK